MLSVVIVEEERESLSVIDDDVCAGVRDAARCMASGLLDGGSLSHALTLAEGVALVFDGIHVRPGDGLLAWTRRLVGLVGVDGWRHDAGAECSRGEEEGNEVCVFHGHGV